MSQHPYDLMMFLVYSYTIFIFSSYRGSPGEVKSVEENPMDQGKVGIFSWHNNIVDEQLVLLCYIS